MKDTIQAKEIIDTYEEHGKHVNFFHPDCSTCFTTNRNKPVFNSRRPMFHSSRERTFREEQIEDYKVMNPQ